MNRRIAFRNARLIDPASGQDVKGWLLDENGQIADIGPRLVKDAEPNAPEVLDCRVPVPGERRGFTGAERAARPAAGRDDGQEHDGDRPCATCV